jgi:hypothetical protein
MALSPPFSNYWASPASSAPATAGHGAGNEFGARGVNHRLLFPASGNVATQSMLLKASNQGDLLLI